MGENSAISWTDHTFNPWEGCQKVGPGCDNCYAEARNNRFHAGVNWGPGAPRRLTSDANWNKPRKWNREAEASGTRPRVFCASLADVFDNAVNPEWRARLWALIKETPHLDWLLLTKRIGNVQDMLPSDWGDGWPNLWLGITVVNQAEVDRDIPKLFNVRTRTNFLSCEPLLEGIDLSSFAWGLDWVIVGGESGPRARAFDIAWAETIVNQCRFDGAYVFLKQLGSNPRATGEPIGETGFTAVPRLDLKDKKGGDPSEWPARLRVQEFPL